MLGSSEAEDIDFLIFFTVHVTSYNRAMCNCEVYRINDKENHKHPDKVRLTISHQKVKNYFSCKVRIH